MNIEELKERRKDLDNKCEAYYLAKYKCTKSFKVGTLFGCNNLIKSLLFRIAMSVADPEELNERENDLLERYFDSVKNKTWVEQTSTAYYLD